MKSNGNLQTRTDARNIKTTYSYDALNRLTGKTYNDGVTTNVTYNWDPAIPNGIGRLGSVANGVGIMNYTGYDALGHITASNQQTPSYYYNFSYSYDLSGALTSETYPSGRVLSTAYDGAGRPTGVSGTLSGVPTNYVSPFPNALEYWPHGVPNLYLYANNVVPVNTFTKLLQSYETYSTVGNNPNNWLLYIGKVY